jgi:acetyltransferase-like isoleucine patch superfamily enzyme
MRPGVQELSVVSEDVIIGESARVGPFCVLGVDGDGGPLVIGEGATIRSQSVIYRGTTIGANFHAGHGVLVRESTTIGDNVSVGSHSIVEHHVTVSDGVRLHSNCFVPEYSVLEVGAWLGPGVIVTNARYPNRPDTKRRLAGVRIGQDAVVGAGAVLLPGVSIGAGALIGAGAVVVDDVAEGETVVGNPGRALHPRP